MRAIMQNQEVARLSKLIFSPGQKSLKRATDSGLSRLGIPALLSSGGGRKLFLSVTKPLAPLQHQAREIKQGRLGLEDTDECYSFRGQPRIAQCDRRDEGDMSIVCRSALDSALYRSTHPLV